MASITFALDEKTKSKISNFSWVNWSEIARQELIKKEKLLELLRKLESSEEQEFIKWSIEIGRKAKKDSFKKLLSELPLKERRDLLSNVK